MPFILKLRGKIFWYYVIYQGLGVTVQGPYFIRPLFAASSHYLSHVGSLNVITEATENDNR